VRLSDGYFSVAIEREGAEAEGKSDMEYIWKITSISLKQLKLKLNKTMYHLYEQPKLKLYDTTFYVDHVDPLLSNDHEINDYTTAVAR
jgi:hypothetical protein